MTEERYQEIRKAIEKGERLCGTIADIAANMVVRGDETTALTLWGAAQAVGDVFSLISNRVYWEKAESQEEQDEIKKISTSDAIRNIRNICENNDCDSCPFFDRAADECVIEDNAPCEWKLPKDVKVEEDE